MVPGVPCVDRGNWEVECDSSSYYFSFALRKDVVFSEECFPKIHALYAHLV